MIVPRPGSSMADPSEVRCASRIRSEAPRAGQDASAASGSVTRAEEARAMARKPWM
jgi:hypothetical protein